MNDLLNEYDIIVLPILWKMLDTENINRVFKWKAMIKEDT